MHPLPSSPHGTNELENLGKNTPDPTHDSVHDSLKTRKTRPCILVVEDDPSVARLLNTVLKDWGYHVCVARNGREGLDVVVNHTVDGILLDMHMPVMNGRTMLDELRWLGHQMPVLAMSGGLDLPVLRQLLKEGAQGFFPKPFTLQSLKQSCRQIFEKEGSSTPFLKHLHLA
ncbi:MAG: response regulator [Nitrospirales bacterium]|nr:response regulator [Nitrospirales bacterium]